MLQKALEDVVEERKLVLLELLGVIGDEKTVDTVSESLARGGSSSRAIAIETLSNFSSAGNTRLLILALEPLLLDRSTADKVSEGRKLWEMPEKSIDEVLTTYMNSGNAWLQAIAVDAAGKHLGSEAEGAAAEWRAQFEARASDGDPYIREATVAALKLSGKMKKTLRRCCEPWKMTRIIWCAFRCAASAPVVEQLATFYPDRRHSCSRPSKKPCS